MKNIEKYKIWDQRFIQLSKVVGSWSSCIRRQVGAVIVKDKRILTTGYNGAPSGVESCKERGECLRNKLNIKSGTMQEICYAIHAEQNALLQAAKMGVSVDGATIYITHQPCSLCARMIANSGIKRIVYLEGYPDDFAMSIINDSNIKIEKYEEDR